MSLFNRLRRIVEAQVVSLGGVGERDRPDIPDAPADEAASRARRAGTEPDLPASVRRAYGVLELEPGADLVAVKKAYRRQQQQYHQDRFAGDATKEKKAQRVSTEINLAYERLVRYLTDAREDE